MGHIKRRQEAFQTREGREMFSRISKADWAELYADLYRACMGEHASEHSIVLDVLERHAILLNYRKSEEGNA